MKDLSSHLQRLYRKAIFNPDPTMIVNADNNNAPTHNNNDNIQLNALIEKVIEVLCTNSFINTYYPSIVFSLRRYVLYCTVGYLCTFSQSVSQSGITNTFDDDNDEVVDDDDDDVDDGYKVNDHDHDDDY